MGFDAPIEGVSTISRHYINSSTTPFLAFEVDRKWFVSSFGMGHWTDISGTGQQRHPPQRL